MIEVIAIFILIGFFGVSPPLTACIDGPGQIVGNLYYATWGVLVFSLAV